MLRIFEQDVCPLINGRAKALIVASSRIAGLRYFNIVKEKLKERGADYKVLYAFSDFVDPETNGAISEHAINELKDGELIENRFEGDDYRLMIVANKFQTGFDQPLLAGMFLDKPVVDRNAVQTVSRLNRSYEGKKDVIVVDFTNNAKAILKAFATYRKGTPFDPAEPKPELCTQLYNEIIGAGVFTQKDAAELVQIIATGTDAEAQYAASGLRVRFQANISSLENRKAFVLLLARFVKSFHFLSCFFTNFEDWLATTVQGLGADVTGAAAALPAGIMDTLDRLRLSIGDAGSGKATTAAMANLAEAIQGLVQHMRAEQQMIRDWADAQAKLNSDIRRFMEILSRASVD
jgi:type I restriction enzyme R subunit